MSAENRSRVDRRSGKDRRKFINFHRLFYRGLDKRTTHRRYTPERRNGWVRIRKWSSVYLWDLKIAKFFQ